jgi:hypothetical protein
VHSVYLYVLHDSYLSYEDLTQPILIGTIDDTVNQFYGGGLLKFLNKFLSMHKNITSYSVTYVGTEALDV